MDSLGWADQYRQPHANDYWAQHKLISISFAEEYIGFAGLAVQDFLPLLIKNEELYALKFYGGFEGEGFDGDDNLAVFRVDLNSNLSKQLSDSVGDRLPSGYWLPDHFWGDGSWNGVDNATQILEMHDNALGACSMSKEGVELVVGAVGNAMVRLNERIEVAEAVMAGAKKLHSENASFVVFVNGRDSIEFATVKPSFWSKLQRKYKRLGEIDLTKPELRFVRFD